MKLISFLGKDKESYGQLSALINRMEDLDQIILLKDKTTENPFTHPQIKLVEVDSSKDILAFKEQIQSTLKPHLAQDFEVALSIASGTGKEHMSLIAALLTIPVGIKLTAFTKQGVEFIS